MQSARCNKWRVWSTKLTHDKSTGPEEHALRPGALNGSIALLCPYLSSPFERLVVRGHLLGELVVEGGVLPDAQ